MIDKIEQSVNEFLQKDIIILIDGKPVKSGKLLLFKFKDFYLKFTIKSESTKTFEIPYPFSVDVHASHLVFSYTIDAFSQKNLELLVKAKLMPPIKKNKLYNSMVVLSAIT